MVIKNDEPTTAVLSKKRSLCSLQKRQRCLITNYQPPAINRDKIIYQSATHEKRKSNKRKRTKKKIIKRKALPAPTILCIVFPHYRIGAGRRADGQTKIWKILIYLGIYSGCF